MAELRIEDVIVRPLITEKNTMLMEQNQYTFEVAIGCQQNSDQGGG